MEILVNQTRLWYNFLSLTQIKPSRWSLMPNNIYALCQQ